MSARGLYRIAPQAVADLTSIHNYIAQDSPSAARKFMGRFDRKILLLSRQPYLGEARDEVEFGLRASLVGRYVIYYRVCEQGDVAVEIIRVLHGARDISQLF